MTSTERKIAALDIQIEEADARNAWHEAARLRDEQDKLVLASLGAGVGVLEYDSNNSGGSWWVSDEGWLALAEAGWTVHWTGRPDGGIKALLEKRGQPGDRWLGAMARSCAKAGTDPQALVDEWSSLTGCNPSDQGCNCCGSPHSFTWHAPDGTERRAGVRIEYVWEGF